MSHNHRQCIETFYTCFQNKDWKGMQQCYHDEIVFSDPAFPHLRGKEAKAMWHMLIAGSSSLTIVYDRVDADQKNGTCHWEATYLFSRTGRKVHNKIDARFEFKDGLIVSHTDTFDFWRWSKMALGLSGHLLGWTPFMKRKIQSIAGHNLLFFMKKTTEYHQ